MGAEQDTHRIRAEREDLAAENVSGVGYKEPMTQFRDLSDLPKAKPRAEGSEPPDPESRFGRVMVEAIHAREVERDKTFRDTANHGVDGARFYHSSSGGCFRAVAYAALSVPESNPTDAPGHFITWLGGMLHDYFQKDLVAAFPEAEVEVKVSGDRMGGHADVVIRGGTYTTVIELKSIGGYAYKLAVGGQHPKPRYSDKIQLALNAKRLDADEAVLVYLARDAFNDAEYQGLEPMARVTAEWTYDREKYSPIAEAEIARIQHILRLVDDEKTLPARVIPDPEYPRGSFVRNPIGLKGKGEWVLEKDGVAIDGKPTVWQCAYCRWQDLCSRTGSHREPVDVLVRLGVLGEEATDGGSREPGQPGDG
jgi:hypothetical protein